MYAEHPEISTPEDSTVIWQYMSVEKYLSLLSTSSLHLCRMDKFEDLWEGVWPKGYKEFARGRETIIQSKTFMFINCWHSSNHESAAMWDLYAKKDSGIALRTTIGELKASFLGGNDVYIGKVKYVDFSTHVETSLINTLVPAFLKRASFEHEKEIRILEMALSHDESGFDQYGNYSYKQGYESRICEVSLLNLLGSVYFSPAMPAWVSDALIDISSKYGLASDRFIQSTLYDDFVF